MTTTHIIVAIVVLATIIALIAILGTILVVADYRHRQQNTKWTTHAVCPCGWHVEAPFGDVFHVFAEVCPECGTYKRNWTIKIMRKANGKWETKEQGQATP